MRTSAIDGRALTTRRRRAGGARRLRARRDRRVHRADARRRRGAHPARATACCASTSDPTACARSSARWPNRASARTARTSPAGPAATRRGCRRAARDPDRVRGGLALPGRVRAGTARDARWPRRSPRAGARQLHVAETEKYPHVTYFFNGGEEAPQEGERRELVPSPRDVPDLRPQAGDERARGGERVRRRLGVRGLHLRHHQLRQRRHGRTHRRDPGGGPRDRDRRPRAWRRSSPRCTARAAPASSPPTTATPITCSSRTAARTRRTR